MEVKHDTLHVYYNMEWYKICKGQMKHTEDNAYQTRGAYVKTCEDFIELFKSLEAHVLTKITFYLNTY